MTAGGIGVFWGVSWFVVGFFCCSVLFCFSSFSCIFCVVVTCDGPSTVVPVQQEELWWASLEQSLGCSGCVGNEQVISFQPY